MAKRIIKWTLDMNVLNMHKYIGSESETELIVGFNLVELYPMFTDMNDTQKQVIVYGVKQKLMDVGASEIADVEGKTVRAKAKYAELLEGKWSGERANATGAQENKRILGEVKTMSKEVSLNGLLLKKAAYPATFTATDQSKLDEFLVRLAQSN